MKDPIPKGSEVESHYQELLDEITSRELDARRIDTYADEALEDLIALVNKIVDSHEPIEDGLSGIEKEKHAFEAAGLDPQIVEDTLDRITEVADSTKRLDALVMKKTKLVDSVIVPPDPNKKIEITAGDGSFEKPKEMIPKLKTLLLLLEKGLDIDIVDDEEVKITAGVLRPNMMRGASYNLIEIPSLNRIVLVCDEVGNTTFVFDQAKCDELDISSLDLYELTKDELRELIDQLEIGVQVDYSKHYVDRLVSAICSTIENSKTKEAPIVSILRPSEVPADYAVVREIAPRIGVSTRTVDLAIIDLEDALSPIITDGRKTRHFSPEDQLTIESYLEQKGVLVPKIAEGYMTVKGMSATFGITNRVIDRAIESLGDQVGEPVRMKVRGVRNTYSPAQCRMIKEWLKQNNYIEIDGISLAELTRQLGEERHLIRKLMKEMGDDYGEWNRGAQTVIISPRQQQEIERRLAEYKSNLPEGFRKDTPDGYLRRTELKSLFKSTMKSVDLAIGALAPTWDEVVYVNSRVGIVAMYSPAQQRDIGEWINKNIRQHSRKIGQTAINDSTA